MSPPRPPYSFAFQPIFDVETDTVFAHEALIRGPAGEGATTVLAQYTGDDLFQLDRDARARAIELAAALGCANGVSLNFLPASLSSYPDAIAYTLQAAERCGMRVEQLILEVTESAVISEPAAFARYVNAYRAQGLRLAIDDFGSGYAGLNLLAEFQPDIVKVDIQLVRDIDRKGPRQSIARAVIQVCTELGVDVVAEGVESRAELAWFKRRGVRLFQGYYLARPSFQSLTATRQP